MALQPCSPAALQPAALQPTTAYSLQPTVCSLQPAAYSLLQPAAYSLLQPAACSLQPAACSLQPAACSIQPCSLQRTALQPAALQPAAYSLWPKAEGLQAVVFHGLRRAHPDPKPPLRPEHHCFEWLTDHNFFIAADSHSQPPCLPIVGVMLDVSRSSSF